MTASCPRRMVAAVSLDASTVLELLSPLAPAYFLPIASVANIGAWLHVGACAPSSHARRVVWCGLSRLPAFSTYLCVEMFVSLCPPFPLNHSHLMGYVGENSGALLHSTCHLDGGPEAAMNSAALLAASPPPLPDIVLYSLRVTLDDESSPF